MSFIKLYTLGSKAEAPDYLQVVSNNRELKSMRDMLMARVNDVMHKTNKLKSAHLKHAYLWTESRFESSYLLQSSKTIVKSHATLCVKDCGLNSQKY